MHAVISVKLLHISPTNRAKRIETTRLILCLATIEANRCST